MSVKANTMTAKGRRAVRALPNGHLQRLAAVMSCRLARRMGSTT